MTTSTVDTTHNTVMKFNLSCLILPFSDTMTLGKDNWTPQYTPRRNPTIIKIAPIADIFFVVFND